MRLAFSRRTTLVLASVAAAAGLLELLAGRSATSDVAASVEARSPGPRHTEQNKTSTLTPAAAQLLLALAHRTTDDSHAGNLFATHSWYVAPPPPPPPPPTAPVAPSAPPFPYAFVGSFTDGDKATVYFLTRNDRVYDVKPGDTLDQIYRFDAIENGQLVFTYKPLDIRQMLPLGGGS